MSKAKLWIILALTAIVLVLIGWSLSDNSDDVPQAVNDQDRKSVV